VVDDTGLVAKLCMVIAVLGTLPLCVLNFSRSFPLTPEGCPRLADPIELKKVCAFYLPWYPHPNLFACPKTDSRNHGFGRSFKYANVLHTMHGMPVVDPADRQVI